MVDFLKANPSITMDEYLWKLSVPMIRIMSADFTHVEYLSENKKENTSNNEVVINSAEDVLKNDLGIPVFGKK